MRQVGYFIFFVVDHVFHCIMEFIISHGRGRGDIGAPGWFGYVLGYGIFGVCGPGLGISNCGHAIRGGGGFEGL